MSVPNTYQNTRPPKSHPYKKCKNKDDCHKICIARARWWDIRMQKLRKELGV